MLAGIAALSEQQALGRDKTGISGRPIAKMRQGQFDTLADYALISW